MGDHELEGRIVDARPDRIDYRDRLYNPPLKSLPASYPSLHLLSTYLPAYHKTSKILNQGKEGACTGFGLAAVINYIAWQRWLAENDFNLDAEGSPAHVSALMLYDMARVYDEWEGEEYSGSSCRGAMKGWHKHGVCEETLWRRDPASSKRPDERWRDDAIRRPLGAYYRVDTRSLADMQAAIFEVGAVYCSARVHTGWILDQGFQSIKIGEHKLPVITFEDEMTGGHAFAIVGYNERGFIIQNSWGVAWGLKGFALLTYEDWLKNGDDAWVAAMAAPMHPGGDHDIPGGRTNAPMQFATSGPAIAKSGAQKTLAPWSQTRAYEHSVVMGNDGKVIRSLIDTTSADDNLAKVMVELPGKAIADGKKHVMLYAHGGLNSEEVAIQRAMRMGPWFEANGLHPIFIVWRTSLMESIGQIGQDLVNNFVKERDELRSEGFWSDVVDKVQNKFDKAFEAVAEKVVGKAVWSQMKQNAAAASKGSGGSRKIVNAINKLRKTHPDFKLHLVGHSAGSILLGHMLDDFKKSSGIETVSLFAPACSLAFAIRYYGKALEKEVIAPGKMHVDNLSDENERDDTVGPYGKSLLYLVSRAFEDPHKMPLLGFETCWEPGTNDLEELKEKFGPYFAKGQIKTLGEWDALATRFDVRKVFLGDDEVVTYEGDNGKQQIKAGHGCFDNDLGTMNRTVARILGTSKPKKVIKDLRGF
ncbi:MAG: C1 family peptidase [Geminicoccales bacterium]